MSEAATTPSLTRTRSVLTAHVTSEDRYVPFQNDRGMRVHVPMEMWNDLGGPNEITIAIWPGDRQDLMESETFPE